MGRLRPVTVLKSVLLFGVAALFEIGGAWLVWQGVREHRGWIWIGAGVGPAEKSLGMCTRLRRPTAVMIEPSGRYSPNGTSRCLS